MNQGDLADAVAEATGAKKAEAAKVVEAVLDAVRDGLKRGEKIAISGFGSFELRPAGALPHPLGHLLDRLRRPPDRELRGRRGPPDHRTR